MNTLTLKDIEYIEPLWSSILGGIEDIFSSSDDIEDVRRVLDGCLSLARRQLEQPLGGPEGVRTPASACAPPVHSDVPPLGVIEKDKEKRETILFGDVDGDGVRITGSKLGQIWVDSDGFFALHADSVKSLCAHLQSWLDTGSFELQPRAVESEVIS